jgi:hypothetical protein
MQELRPAQPLPPPSHEQQQSKKPSSSSRHSRAPQVGSTSRFRAARIHKNVSIAAMNSNLSVHAASIESAAASNARLTDITNKLSAFKKRHGKKNIVVGQQFDWKREAAALVGTGEQAFKVLSAAASSLVELAPLEASYIDMVRTVAAAETSFIVSSSGSSGSALKVDTNLIMKGKGKKQLLLIIPSLQCLPSCSCDVTMKKLGVMTFFSQSVLLLKLTLLMRGKLCV